MSICITMFSIITSIVIIVSSIQCYISKGACRLGRCSFVRSSYVSTLCPVVICPYLCTSEVLLRPIPLLTLSLLTLLESNLPGNPLWTWEFHPFRLRSCLSQAPWSPQSVSRGIGRMPCRHMPLLVHLWQFNTIIIICCSFYYYYVYYDYPIMICSAIYIISRAGALGAARAGRGRLAEAGRYGWSSNGYTYIYIYIYIYIYVDIYIYVCVYIYIYMLMIKMIVMIIAVAITL